MSSFSWYNPLTWGYGWINAAATVDQPAPQSPVKQGESDPLKRTPYYFGAGGVGVLGQFPPYVDAPPLTDNTMRAMSMHSTLAFLFANIVKPISASTYTVEVNPAMAEKPGMAEKLEKRKKYIEAAFKPITMGAIRSACRALQFGRWTQESIFDRVDGFTVPVRFKSFLPWEVQLLRDPYNDFAGVRYQGTERDARYIYHHVNDPEMDPIFGYSRHGNVLPEWWHKLQDAVELSRLSKKAASIVPIVKGPSGKRPDVDGSMKDGLTICKGIAAALSRGEPVYMPQYLFEEEGINPSNADITKFTAFDIDTVDLGEQGPAMMALLEKMAYEDVSFSRGWHQPERASMEGQHGTKAEAGVHKAGSTEDSETVFRDIIDSFNRGPLDQTLIANDGPEAKGSIFFKAAQLQDPDKAFKQDLLKAGITNANAAPEILASIDQRKLMDEAELPLKSEEDADAALEEIQQKNEAQQQQKLEAMRRANGNGSPNGKKPAIAASADGRYTALASRLARYLDDDE